MNNKILFLLISLVLLYSCKNREKENKLQDQIEELKQQNEELNSRIDDIEYIDKSSSNNQQISSKGKDNKRLEMNLKSISLNKMMSRNSTSLFIDDTNYKVSFTSDYKSSSIIYIPLINGISDYDARSEMTFNFSKLDPFVKAKYLPEIIYFLGTCSSPGCYTFSSNINIPTVENRYILGIVDRSTSPENVKKILSNYYELISAANEYNF